MMRALQAAAGNCVVLTVLFFAAVYYVGDALLWVLAHGLGFLNSIGAN